MVLEDMVFQKVFRPVATWCLPAQQPIHGERSFTVCTVAGCTELRLNFLPTIHDPSY